VFAGGHNPAGHKDAATFAFPYANDRFDLTILCSILTHILPDAIENYLRQTARVLVSGGSAFISVFLFDLAAETAVRNGTTIFDFRHQIGPCLTFDPGNPEEGIACRETWFFEAIKRSGLRLAEVRRGDWRNVRSYAITHDYVSAKKP
jgi:SAM-dependent methyltransferase